MTDGHGQRPRARTNERNHLGDQRIGAALCRDLIEPFAEGPATEEHRLIRFSEPMDIGFGRSAPSHADDVEADQIRYRTLDEAKGDHVGAHAAQPQNHCAFADTHELTHSCRAAEHREVADRDMAAQDHVVGKDYVVADLAVMADVGPYHEPAAISDFGYAAIVLGPGIHGDAFTDIAFGADHESGRAAAVSDGLRRSAQRGEWIKHGARADCGMPRNMYVSNELATVPDLHVRANDAIRPDRYVVADHRPRFDAGGRIDCRHCRPHATMAPTSASATVCPAPFASPLNQHLFFFRAS